MHIGVTLGEFVLLCLSFCFSPTLDKSPSDPSTATGSHVAVAPQPIYKTNTLMNRQPCLLSGQLHELCGLMGMAAQQPLLLRDCFSYQRLRLCFRPCLCLCFCLWRALRACLRPCLHRCRHHVYIGCFTRTCNGLAAVVNGEHERSNGVLQCKLSLNRLTCIFCSPARVLRL